MQNINSIGSENKREKLMKQNYDHMNMLPNSENFSFMLENAVVNANDQQLNKDKEFYKDLDQEQTLFSEKDLEIFSRMIVSSKKLDIKNNQNISDSNAADNEKINTQQGDKNSQSEIEINVGDVRAMRTAAETFARNFLAKIDLSKIPVQMRDNIKISDIFKVIKAEEPKKVPFPEFFNEIVKEVKSTKLGSIDRLKLTLHPEKFGEVSIYFVLDENKRLHLSFLANEQLKEMIENEQQQLKNILLENGYDLENMEFADFHQNSDQLNGEQKDLNGQKSAQNPELLNIKDKKDIIVSINNYISDQLISYFA